MRAHAFGGALLAIVVASGPARSQGNDRSSPTGGRSALMGGTGVALARDGAAPFTNPATMGTVDDQRIAFSVNFFTYEITHFSGWNQPGPVDAAQFGAVHLNGAQDESSRFQGLPSTLCLFLTLAGLRSATEGTTPEARRSRQKLAFCIGSLELTNVNLTSLSFTGSAPAGQTAQVESIARSWNRLYVGPSYSLYVTDALSVGLSLHGVATSESFVVDGSNVTSLVGGSTAQAALGTAGSGYSFDLAAILGATYRLGMTTLGASVQFPALHVLGHYQATAHDEYGGMTGADDVADLTNGSGSFVARPPPRASLGVGVELPRLTLEADASYDFAESGAIKTSLQGSSTDLAAGVTTTSPFAAAYAIAAHPTVNGALGAEYFVTRSFSVIGGASTNVSMLSALSPSASLGNLVQSRTNYVSTSLGIGSYGGGGDLLFGVKLDYGWGQALVVDPYVLPNEWAEVSTYSYAATLILAGATDLRAIGRAVEKVERVVTTGSPDAVQAPQP
jgi:hypothetical protein